MPYDASACDGVPGVVAHRDELLAGLQRVEDLPSCNRIARPHRSPASPFAPKLACAQSDPPTEPSNPAPTMKPAEPGCRWTIMTARPSTRAASESASSGPPAALSGPSNTMSYAPRPRTSRRSRDKTLVRLFVWRGCCAHPVAAAIILLDMSLEICFQYLVSKRGPAAVHPSTARPHQSSRLSSFSRCRSWSICQCRPASSVNRAVIRASGWPGTS